MSDGENITILLNGDSRAIAPGLDLTALLGSLGLPVQGVLIEHNGTALLRDEWPNVRLADGDRLEILRVVAGG